MNFAIPEFSIRVVDGKLSPDPVELQTKVDVTTVWLDAAIDHLSTCRAVARKLDVANKTGSEKKVGELLYLTMISSMQAITSCGIAVSAYQSTLYPFANVTEKTKASWKKNKTPSYKRSAHIIGRAFRLPNTESKRIWVALKEHSKFRDWAVHPSSHYKTPVLHPDTGRVTDWRFTAFNFSNAQVITRQTIQIIDQSSSTTKRKLAEGLPRYCEVVRSHLVPVSKKWRRRFGDLYESDA